MEMLKRPVTDVLFCDFLEDGKVRECVISNQFNSHIVNEVLYINDFK